MMIETSISNSNSIPVKVGGGPNEMMRLSEAIRLGALIRPQGFYSFISSSGSCALGAAFEAIGGIHLATPREWAWTCERLSSEFALPNDCGCVWHSVQYLNDEFRWTRERIADWVETIENRLALEPVAATVEEVLV